MPFIRDLKYAPAHNGPDPGYDASLSIRTPHGTFQFLVGVKQSYLAQSEVSQLATWLGQSRKDHRRGILLLARHIPRPAAERLMKAEMNFADDAGNIHLALGNRYNWTVIGMPALKPVSERRPTSRAQLQLLFQFVTHPDSVNWPVRRLEPAAGISKSKAAQARRELIAEGLLVRVGKEYRLGPKSRLDERLVSGYGQILRPKLTLGTYRPAEKTPEMFLARLRRALPSTARYSLTGGPAADLLQHFYRGQEIPLFLKASSRSIVQQLRLLPDRNGPVTILNAFGELVFWQEREHHTLAPPWLIYAELLSAGDPRAHEAAQELRQEFLA